MPRNSGPIEQITMPEMVDAPVFRQLIDLENNSKYYMMLLNVREAELERLTKAYEDIQVTLKCCLTTNLKLKDRVELLERMLEGRDDNKRKEIDSYKKQISGHNKNFAEVKLDNEARFRQLENEYKRKILENETSYVDKLNKKEIEFGKKIEELMVKYQRETVLNCKLKNDVQVLMKVNVGLTNKIQHLHSNHSADKSSFESELNLLKDFNDVVKTDMAILQSRLDEVLIENEKLKRIVVDCREEIRQNSISFDDYKRTNNKLTHELNGYKKRNKRLKIKIEEEVMDKGKMREEIEKLKILGNVKLNHSQCNIPEHENYNDVKRQNEVLQELVKNMRRERNNKENEDLRQAEDRIERLEGAIEDFKKSSLFNCVSINNNVQEN